MICVLCPEPLDQSLDQSPLATWCGLPVHADCAALAERDAAAALAEAEAMIAAEPNPRRHRKGWKAEPTAA